jgi:hypothetical protein
MGDSASAGRRVEQATPGPLGYALAIAIGFFALVMQSGFVAYLDGDKYWTPINTALLVLFVGLIPAAVIGGLGATVVHFATRRLPSQWPAILLAGLLGLLVGLAIFPDDLRLAAFLAIDAAGGRLAVVPMARRRKAGLS